MYPTPQILSTNPILERVREFLRQQFANPSNSLDHLIHIRNDLSGNDGYRHPNLISTDTHVPPPAPQTVRSPADMRASRAGLGLPQIVRWRVACPEGWVRDDLSRIARDLVDAVNGKFMPCGTDALLRNLPKNHKGCGTFPWNDDDLEKIRCVPGSIYSPANPGIDESTLGTRSLAGVLIAHLWEEPVLQRRGTHDRVPRPPTSTRNAGRTRRLVEAGDRDSPAGLYRGTCHLQQCCRHQGLSQ